MRTQIRRASPVARSALMILAGWQPQCDAKAAPHGLFALAGRQPHHHSLEAAAAELADQIERDAAARQAFARGDTK